MSAQANSSFLPHFPYKFLSLSLSYLFFSTFLKLSAKISTEKMNQKNLHTSAAILILCFFFLSLIQGNERDKNPPSSSFPDLIRRKFSNSAQHLKTLLNRAQIYFFPPNLDFRGREEGIESKMKEGEGKLKEAIVESMGKTKATVEESAKSAAELVTETVKDTKEKVKRSLWPDYIEDEEL